MTAWPALDRRQGRRWCQPASRPAKTKSRSHAVTWPPLTEPAALPTLPLLGESPASTRHATRSMSVRLTAGVFFVTLLAAILLVLGSASRAHAHPGHDHSTEATSPATLAVAPDDWQIGPSEAAPDLPFLSTEVIYAPDKPTAPQHQGNCCCGSIACHAGVATPVMDVADPYRLAERLLPPPLIAWIRGPQDGIERPPRAASLV